MSSILRETIVIHSDTGVLCEVREFVSRNAQKAGFSREEANRLTLAVDEAVTNVIEHGYGQDTEGSIDIQVVVEENRFQVNIRDEGRHFDPASIEVPDILQHVRQGKKRGLGIFIMRQIMDEVRYTFQEGARNEVILVKYLRQS